MKKFLVAVACVCAAFMCPSVSTAAPAGDGAGVTLDDVVGGSYYGQRIAGVRPLADGESYARISPDGKKIVRHSFRTGRETGIIFDATATRGDVKVNGVEGYIMSPDESRILIQTKTRYIYRRSFTAEYFIYDVKNNRLTPLSEGGPQQAPVFSPDGNVIAFAREGDLYLCKLLFGGAETRVTKDGERGKVLNGIPDWVYEEEFSTNCSFCFSADSKMLAWIRYDESQVPLFSFDMYKGAYPTLTQNDVYPGAFTYKYPVAGERNSTVSVMTFDIKNRATRTIEVPMDSDGYIPRIRFTDNPDQLAIVALNRHQSRMDLYMANPRSTVCKLVLREENDRYLRETAYESLRFYGDHFAMLSERDGYQHLYWYTTGGRLERQVTKGQYEVTAFHGYDPATGRFYYTSCEESPLRRAVYVKEKNGKVRKLSTEQGTNEATFSTSFKYFMNVYSSATQPYVTTLRSNDGKVLTTLLDNADLKAKADATLGQKEFFSFTTGQGVTLNGYMIKPRNFDPSKKYPVLMYQYSGPGSQEVKDSWGMGFYGAGVFESYLNTRGYICVCVDGRGTGFRGADFEKCTYLRLGEKESNDQVEAALYLGTLPYIDKDNIAIWGWSFGGFNTLMAMGEGRPVFRCGIAVAAPSNWKYYDTVYTERYMRTPQENADGYKVNPMERAGRFHGDLLLMHGTADDNVHLRNAMEMSEALVQANKQFEMQIYTNRNHSIYGGNTRRHLLTRLCNFLDAKMK